MQAYHALAAVLTNQPVFQLTEAECNDLSEAFCAVADYHNIDLDNAGGPWGLYGALGVVLFRIYQPRLAFIAMQKKGAPAMKTANPGTVEAAAMAEQAPNPPKGTMDFSADVTVN